MVVADLFVVDAAFHIRFCLICRKRIDATAILYQLSDGLLHIFRQELAIGTRIGTQLFLIQCLYGIQYLLGGITEVAVGFPLQGGQVIELGRCDGFFLPA